MNKEQQELLDEAFLNYWKKVSVNNEEDCLVKQEEGSFLKEVRALYQQEFISKCKTNTEFSKIWGLKIEERELSLEEKTDWLNKNYPLYGLGEWAVDKLSDKGYLKEVEVEYNIPTKLITITYNDKTIESYE
jgi:hypothetical protein